MSLADEIELQGVAVDLIAEYGRTVSLIPPGNTSDANQPWKGTTGDGAAISASAVFTPARRELVPGTAVQVGDQVAKVATRDLATIPTTSWAILDNGRRLNIVAVGEVKPGNSSFIFEAQVRASG